MQLNEADLNRWLKEDVITRYRSMSDTIKILHPEVCDMSEDKMKKAIQSLSKRYRPIEMRLLLGGRRDKGGRNYEFDFIKLIKYKSSIE